MVGIGPGNPLDRTRRAETAIEQSTMVVGYKPYLAAISDLTTGKELIASGMRQEAERCRAALERAAAGETVALISSGDAGVYGMAGLAMEMAAREGFRVSVEVIPGITSANAAAALMGAPLMLDYAVVSLSDLLVPWEGIRKRIEALAAADLVVALYNPRSRKRISQLQQAAEIFRQHRPGTTPVGIATAVSREGETVVLSDPDRFLEEEITMQSIVIVGSSTSKFMDGWFVTPRGYRL